MNCSTPSFPVFHYLQKFAQTNVHWVGDAVQPSHPLPPLSPLALKSFPASGTFPMMKNVNRGTEIETDKNSLYYLCDFSVNLKTFRVFLLQWFPSSHQVKDRCVSDTFSFHWYFFFFNAFLSGLNILKCPIDKNIL